MEMVPERMAIALERIAAALEAANAADPLLAIQAALQREVGDEPDEEIPPHIRRAMGLDDQ